MNELRFALRMLRRHPGFTSVAVATLALGIGLNATIFGILNGLLLKPPAVAAPAQLVWLASASPRPDAPRGFLTYADFLALQARQDVLADAFVFAPAALSLSTGRTALRVDGQVVTGRMFDILGVRMNEGRAFLAEEDRTPGTHPVAVLGHRLWMREFGGDPLILGRGVVLNGQPFTVVGIAPPGFVGPDRLSPAELWVPLMMHQTAIPGLTDGLGRSSWWLLAVGRLAKGVSREQAAATLDGVARGLALSSPRTHEGFMVRVIPFLGTAPSDRQQVRPVAALILAVTLTVLLIACANIAGLLLSRSAGRRREIGIRLSLGATPGALIRQLLVESALVSGAAGAAGLLAAMWSADALLHLAGVPAAIDTAPDWRVLSFTILLAFGATLAFGLPPALRAARRDIVPALRGEPASSDGRGAFRLQRVLVVGQLAVSLVLVVGAGLFIKGLSRAWSADVGFTYEGRVALSVDLRLQRYDATRAAAFYPRLLEEVRALPGVRDATLAHMVPFGGRVFVHTLAFPGQAFDPDRLPDRASVNRVWTGFFETVGIPVIAGRDFDSSDLKAVPEAAIISETMARRFWPDGHALGQRFSVEGPDGPYVSVVGVARDTRIDEFTERPWPAVYLPHDRRPSEIALIAWSPRGAGDLLREIQQVVRGLDPDLAIYGAKPLRQYVAERLDGERALSSLLSLCSGLALALAGLGLYGVMSHAVARRTPEIGVRMALGATRRDVVGLFVGEALRLGMWGVVAGLGPAVALTYAAAGQLVGVSAGDPLTLAGAAALLVSATVTAAWLPTARATRIDPLKALRTE